MNLALLKVAVIKQGTEYDDDRNGYIYPENKAPCK